MRTFTPFLSSLFLLSACSLANAAPNTTEGDQTTSKIKATLEARFANIKIESVAPAPWNGLYEVATATELVYTNGDASILFAGRIIDTQTKQDLTSKRWNDLNTIDFAKLPFELAIKNVKGNGSRKLVVFADPLCPYCKQLEEQMQEMTDVTIFTFILPLESIHAGATEKANRIWCAKDRKKAWSSWMIDKVEPEHKSCNTDALSTVKAWSEKLKVNSTPTLFFADGHRVAGVVSNKDLEKNFAADR